MSSTAVQAPIFPSFAQVFQGLVGQIGQLRQMAPTPTLPEATRVRRAIATLIAETNADEAVWLESCIRCGQCTSACHYFQATGDTKYAPLRKMNLYRRVYQREIGPFRWWYRLVTRPIGLKDLEALQELVYDSCSECGRCTMVCPMGIDIASLVHHQRSALVAAELVPPELAALQMEQKQRGTVFGASAEALHRMVDTIRERAGVAIPLDKARAEVMVLSSAVDLVGNGNGLLATARVMNHLGVDWTICSDGFESANFGLLSGDMALWKRQVDPIVAAAKRIGAKTLVIAECGHAYPALRWNPTLKGEDLPFEMMYMSEYLGRQAKAGRLRLRPLQGRVTYHDPCKTGRRGGAFDEPRAVLRAMQADFVELPANKEFNWCCGGGAGIFLLERATRLRDESFKIKMRQVDMTGAEAVVVSCASCRLNFEAGRHKNQWNKRVESLVELVAAHLLDDAPQGAQSPIEEAAA
ncbi:(Fe-S)-binding protein [Thermochromatium tepidum]|uniref:4Fe-4S dicluster domain-containing protein n=1 Tax=Thermochromatium tepidum ATCC 43061 TaxID=316276 RepID=A0A6I6E207_THETI|nr:(Fe-S)-binding protein [Thermochromatium tepidum]QGU32965.1 4Fe-4S dicluster domain-containing protein [Thermochromatium tepidum ATCC 43061]